MVIIYTLPVFMAYGIVYNSGFFFYICFFLSIVALSFIASALSTLLVMLAVILVPASRMKNIFIFFCILFFVVLYIAIRFLQPELLVDPEVFDTNLSLFRAHFLLFHVLYLLQQELWAQKRAELHISCLPAAQKRPP